MRNLSESVRAEIDRAWELFRDVPYRDRKAIERRRCSEAQNHRCCYCGVRCDGTHQENDSPSLEHIWPVSRGGAVFDPNNLAMACRHCNTVRGDEIWPMHLEALSVMGIEPPALVGAAA